MEQNNSFTDKRHLKLILYKIIRKMGIPRCEVSLPARLSYDLGFDTFDMNIFLFFLEARFDIEIKENDIQKLQTIGHTINFIEEKLVVA